jgi:hypothetical protein
MAAVEKDVTQATAKAKPEAEVVTMKDGRKVEFVGKRRMLKNSIESSEGGPAVRLDFRNGETINFTLPQELFEKFALHGAEQKLGDETAGEDDVDDMYLAVEELVGRLNKGEWSIKREGGGFGGTSVLLKALVEYSGRTVDQIKTFLQGKSQAEKMAMRNSTKVGPSGASIKDIVQRLESEKVAKAGKVDVGSLLAGLEV